MPVKSLGIVGLIAGLTYAQAQPFRSSIEAVRVDALVTDGNRPIAGLTDEDFELADSGVPQRIDSVAVGDVPINATVVLDTSASVAGPVVDNMKLGVLTLVHALTSEDRASVIQFASQLNLVEERTNDAASIAAKIRDVHVGGGTSLYDAVFAALSLRDPTPVVRQVIIVFSDGEDTASWLPASAVVERARRTDAVVFAIVSGRSTARRPGEVRLMFSSGIQLFNSERTPPVSSESFLTDLCSLTGGAVFTNSDINDLQKAFARIVLEFRTRYLLTYVPQGVTHAGWHPIEVKLRHARGRVTARRGYVR